LTKEIAKEDIRRLLRFLKNYVRFDKSEIASDFDIHYNEIIKTENTMGIDEVVLKWAKIEGREEGRQEGRQEAMTELQKQQHEATKTAVRNMRKKNFDKTLIAEILSLSYTEIDAFFKELDKES
jgi:predicted transposase YdaD